MSKCGKNIEILKTIEFLKSKPAGFEYISINYISMIKNGFIVRFQRWQTYNKPKRHPVYLELCDIYNFDGTLLFCNEKELNNFFIKPLCGTFKTDDKYEDVIKVLLRQKKFKRLLNNI